jgi:hypothetical protein
MEKNSFPLSQGLKFLNIPGLYAENNYVLRNIQILPEGREYLFP